MPVRKYDPNLEKITREYGNKSITRTKEEWKYSDRDIAEVIPWNEVMKKKCLELQAELRDSYETDEISIVSDSYNKVSENQDFDKFTPRNYLAHEVVRVTNGSEKRSYYFGKFGAEKELFETVIKDIYAKRTKGENSRRGSSDNVESDGSGLDEQRLQGDSEEGVESNVRVPRKNRRRKP